MRQAKYYVYLWSQQHGEDRTAWDTLQEANAAVNSIIETSAELNDGIERHIWIMYRGRRIGILAPAGVTA